MNSSVQPRPRLMIAGAHSGVGKSTITLGLVAALKKRGLKVQTFKVGPDYLDPSHLAQVSGRPCYNLDGWMSDRTYAEQLFLEHSADADISLIEGVMGLFDGSSSEALSGSSAEISAWLKCPVALVVNTHGMARSVAALVKGYNELEDEVKLAGVIANRSGSASHAKLLDTALRSAGQPPLLGAVQRDSLPLLSSRHLGLISAMEQGLESDKVEELGRSIEDQLDLDLLLEQASAAKPLPISVINPKVQKSVEPVKLAVARDEAFQFYYPDFFNQLESLGCEPVFFSPMRDSAIPDEVDGLYLGGGYPEVQAELLAANTSMLDSIRSFCNSGRPVYAECGGLIYLTQGVEQEGQHHTFVGELPVRARMLEKRKALGYVEACLLQDSLFGQQGDVFRGHEFHYSELIESPIGIDGWQAIYQLKQKRSGNLRPEGYQRGSVLASYAHLHLASQPQAVSWFVEQLRK
jgi:cobyrinic acid a,c-diamide synthase